MQILIRALLLIFGSYLVNPLVVVAAEPNARLMREADPTLARFVKTEVDTNPRVQAARAALDASTAFKSASSRALYNPELILDAENSDSNTRSIGLSQTLDWGGKRQARTAVAESDRLAVEAEYLRVRWAITTELLSGLTSHQIGTTRNQLARERARLMDDFATLAKRRFDAGDLTQVELDLATLASTNARMMKATAAADLAEARQAVRELTTGSTPSQWPTMPDQSPELPNVASNPQQVLLALPTVRVAQRRLDSARAVVELRKREKRPDPTISLTAGREAKDTLVGLNLSIPLYIRNRYTDEVSVAIAEHDQAQQLADDVLRRAQARLISATERYQLSEGAWRDWEQTGSVSLIRQAEQIRRLWEAGEISTTDYLVQLRQTLDVQGSALDLRRTLWRAWFEWMSASGQVDAWLGGEGTR